MASQPNPRPAKLREKAQLMSASEIERTLIRLAHEIVEKNNGVQNLALVGIRRRGAPLAKRLAQLMRSIEKTEIPVGTLDVAAYRDDLLPGSARPESPKDEMDFDVTGKNIVLVDDVLYTGRTTRAAMEALFEHGRPRRVQLCVLVDRGHRELPIDAAFVGRVVQTTEREAIEVKLQETDKTEKVLLAERSGDS